MAENLNYGEMTTDDELVPGRKWCYDNDEANSEGGYGGLYTWNVAKKSCPPGWHLPTKEEWEKLFEFVVSNVVDENAVDEEDFDEYIPFGIANALAIRDFDDAVDDGDGFFSPDDSCRFGAMPAGRRQHFESRADEFYGRGEHAVWWSASQCEGKPGVRGYILDPADGLGLARSGCSAEDGWSVRCVKDQSSD